MGFAPLPFVSTGLAEMRALLCEPVLLRAGSAVGPVARVQTRGEVLESER